MTASSRIQDRLALFGAGWKRRSAEFWTSPELGVLYPEMLKASYQVIRGSVPLLEAARDRCLGLPGADPLREPLAAYFAAHAEEERGHDAWVARDLEALGVRPGDVERSLPSPIVAGLVGAQHYWMAHAHPVALLGYLAVLEGEPPDESLFEDAAVRAGLPAAAFSTLRYHARVDQEHWRDLLALLDRLELRERDLALIGLSILHTCEGMDALIGSVLAGQPARV